MDRNKSSNEKINKKKDQTKQLAFLFMNFYCNFYWWVRIFAS